MYLAASWLVALLSHQSIPIHPLGTYPTRTVGMDRQDRTFDVRRMRDAYKPAQEAAGSTSLLGEIQSIQIL